MKKLLFSACIATISLQLASAQNWQYVGAPDCIVYPSISAADLEINASGDVYVTAAAGTGGLKVAKYSGGGTGHRCLHLIQKVLLQ